MIQAFDVVTPSNSIRQLGIIRLKHDSIHSSYSPTRDAASRIWGCFQADYHCIDDSIHYPFSNGIHNHQPFITLFSGPR